MAVGEFDNPQPSIEQITYERMLRSGRFDYIPDGNFIVMDGVNVINFGPDQESLMTKMLQEGVSGFIFQKVSR